MREDSLQRKAGYVEIWMLRTIWDFFAQRSLILTSHSHNFFSWDVEWLHSWGCWMYNKRATFTQVSISFSHRWDRISITSKHDVNNEEYSYIPSLDRPNQVCLFHTVRRNWSDFFNATCNKNIIVFISFYVGGYTVLEIIRRLSLEYIGDFWRQHIFHLLSYSQGNIFVSTSSFFDTNFMPQFRQRAF